MRRKYLTALREDLKGGRFGANGKLPSFRELASLYECSVASIKLAVDTLQGEGVLEPIHGKGTFFSSRGHVPLPRSDRRKLIGAVLLHDGWMEVMEQLRHEWQRNGWFFSLYDACMDMQDPAREREFLQMALSEGFSGVILVATPLAPVNTELFAELRRRGMKIVHLAPYQSDMSCETYFMLDYAAAGELAVRRCRAEGIRNLLPVRDGSRAPSVEWLAEGLRREETDVRILPTFCYQQQTREWVREANHSDELARWDEIRGELLPLLTIGADTAIFAYRAEAAAEIRRFFDENGIPEETRPPIRALHGLTPFNVGVDAVRYDLEAQIRAALEYVCDEGVDPVNRVQRIFPPVGFASKN